MNKQQSVPTMNRLILFLLLASATGCQETYTVGIGDRLHDANMFDKRCKTSDGFPVRRKDFPSHAMDIQYHGNNYWSFELNQQTYMKYGDQLTPLP